MPPTQDDQALFEPEAASGFHLAEYLQVARRHWKLVAASTLVCMAGGAVHFFITPKQYRASTTIQIERRSMTSVTGDQNPWLENYWNMEYYPTQYRLLQSRGLAERVVLNLRLFEDSEYDSRAATRASRNPSAAEDLAALGGLAGGILGGLEVTPIANTQLVEIGYRSSSPELAARIANGVADAYIDWGIETRSTTASKATTFLGSEIETLQKEIEDRELQQQAYSRRTDIVTMDPGSNVLEQRMESLNTDYSKAVTERINAEARYSQLANAGRDAVAELATGGLVAQMRSEQLTIVSCSLRICATKLNTYKPEWPAMVELKARIDRGRIGLNAEIDKAARQAREAARTEYQTAQRREQALAAQLNRVKSESMDLSSASNEYNNLASEIATRRATLDQLLKRQSESEVASRLQTTRDSNVRIVDRALVPGGPFRPSLRQDLSLGMLLGLMLGIGGMLLIEFLDRTIKTPEELERLLGLPTLAVIPDIAMTGKSYGYSASYGYGYGAKRKGEKKTAPDPDMPIELLPHNRPRLVASEAYRSLRTSLLLSSADKLKVVAITSSESGDGKTATATNLAVVMAQLGGTVLLVDGDLRKPRLHDVFSLSNRVGLVSYLTGQVKQDQIFLRTSVPNLLLTPSGPIAPNPSELLSSARMREFVQSVGSLFDFVIIDTPPTLAVTDPTLVGSMVDGVVLCVCARRVLREDAKACRERLRMADVRVLGTVLNRYREVRTGYGRRYQQYYAADHGSSERHPASGSAA
jgi:polysaccharide biosynthesis transport protein